MASCLTTNEMFRRLRARPETFAAFGFTKKTGGWECSTPIVGGTFSCVVTINKAGEVSERVVDCATGDEYVQHRVAAAVGAFVGRVRQEVDAFLERIAAACFERDVFKTDPARLIVEFARKNWGDELEFLWKQFPDYAVLRRTDTQKWYAILMRLPRRKLGFDSDEAVEIIDLRRTSDTDDPRYLPGYHMNKKSWMTIVLDGTVSLDEITGILSASYDCAI